jgi:hypothetical protein
MIVRTSAAAALPPAPAAAAAPALPITGLLLAVTVIELSVALYLGVKLTFLTDLARQEWMWAMPPYGTRFMGTIYLAALVPIGALLLVRRQSIARLVNPIVFVFGLVLLGVSLAYFGRFRTDTWSTWLWFGLYVVMPATAALELWRDRRRPSAGFARSAPGQRGALAALGIVLGAYGLAQLVAPVPASAFWPWSLDDFHGRLYSAVFLAPAAGALLLARRGAAPLDRLTLGLTCALLGVLPIVAVITMDAALHRVAWGAAGPRAWVLSLAALAAAGLSLIWSAFGQYRVPNPAPAALAPTFGVLTAYLWLVGGALLLQGLAALALAAAGLAPALLVATHALTDPRHSVMHVLWGVALLAALARRPGRGTVTVLGLVFGGYYTALAFYIANVGSPFGMQVDASQNTFHFTVGPLSLALGAWSLGALAAGRWLLDRSRRAVR